MMRIYLAARYSRRLELCGYREQLRAAGHTVQAVWLDGEHQISDTGTPIGEHGEALVEGTFAMVREIVHADPVEGTDGFLVTLSCGHKLATRRKATSYSCQECFRSLRPGERLSQEDASERAAALRQKFAQDDFRDVMMCELLIAFTEPPRSEKSRGGRHVELGIALGMMKRVWIVGPRENIFCWLDDVQQFDGWEGAAARLGVVHADKLPPI